MEDILEDKKGVNLDLEESHVEGGGKHGGQEIVDSRDVEHNDL